MAEVRVERTWEVAGLPEGLAPGVLALTGRHGLRDDGSAADLRLKGGSQARLRLLGGWFINQDALPKRVTATFDGGGRVSATFESTMGVGIMDRKLRGKYERALASIAADFETALRSAGGDVTPG